MSQLNRGMKTDRLDHYRSTVGSRRHQKKYMGWGKKSVRNSTEHAILARLLERAGRSEEILDAPCGAGRFFPVVANYTEKVFLGDISPQMLDIAREQTKGLAAGYACLDLRSAPAAGETYEGVVSIRLTHHIYDEDVVDEYFDNLSHLARRWLIVTFRDASTPKVISRAWMRRLQGKPPLPAQTLEEVSTKMGARGFSLADDVQVSRWFSGHHYALFIRIP